MVNVLDAVGEWTIHSGPLYQRLAIAIRNAVLRGDLAPGTILPAERHMARALAVGRSTVVAAYDMLRSDGVLTSKQGSGTWVAGAERNASSRSSQQESLGRAALSGGEQLIDLATATLPAAPAVRDAIVALGDGMAEPLLEQTGYSALGLLELRRAVADMFSEEGLHTSPEQILITTGDQQALSLLTQHLLDTGDSVLVEDPTSPGMLDLVRREPVVVRSARSLSSSGEQALLGVVAKSEPSLVYLISSFGPEGLVCDGDSLRRLASGLRGFSGAVIEDSSSRHLLRDDAPPHLAALARDTTVFTVGSMSKLFWGGLRIGWIRGDENAILRLSRAKARADLGTPLLSQMLSAWLLRRLPEVKAQRHREIDLRTAEAVDVVRRELPDFELTEPAGAVSLWLRMPHGASRPFAETARRLGVAIVPGDSLSADGASDPYIRLALGADATAFADGVARLGRAWTEYDRGAANPSGSPLGPPLV
ncbi:PLP-dependent aminotransferase family protein [Herbiconiux sp. L3-i23]|uniref:aminotransferase-like domain-containing protein n=1 Tax=Herbiconiux sp. L3-i23 TaxID=2905871 RepID=UPI00204B01D4|nr:PLP-dependent aminotransferase family protein [Herbiconiux sp. L3-i23]BDI22567.1 putative GntR-family regulatory protein [Herbiconiux sp. L3-i23]